MDITHADKADREIVISDAVAKLTHFSRLYGIESIFIVGGFCRSLYFDRLWDVNDIDVASAFHEQAIQLGGLFASEVLKTTPTVYKRSGAATVEYKSELGSVKIEFQGQSVNAYMHNQEVRDWMHQNGVDDVPLMNNLYGRDFTINALIYSFKDQALHDPLGIAARALEKKRIISILPANMLVKYNPLSILRAIRFALMYDFFIDEDMRNAMVGGLELLTKSLTQERIMQEIVRILRIDGPKGLEMLKRYELDKILLNPALRGLIDEQERHP